MTRTVDSDFLFRVSYSVRRLPKEGGRMAEFPDYEGSLSPVTFVPASPEEAS